MITPYDNPYDNQSTEVLFKVHVRQKFQVYPTWSYRSYHK